MRILHPVTRFLTATRAMTIARVAVNGITSTDSEGTAAENETKLRQP